MAFILALVVRGFEAQAFVIPTGSMAPTLMGRHKEIACPQCGFVYAVNASEEVEAAIAGSRTCHSGLCVNCRYQALRLDDDAELQGRPNPGDDVSLRPAVPAGERPSRALGCRGLPLSRRAGSQLHQAPGRACPARPSGSTTAMSIVKSAGERQVHPGPKAVATSDRRCRSTSTTIAIGPVPWRKGRVAALAERATGWKVVDPAEQSLQVEGRPERRVGRAALPPSRARSRAVGRDPQRTGRCRGRPAPR